MANKNLTGIQTTAWKYEKKLSEIGFTLDVIPSKVEHACRCVNVYQNGEFLKKIPCSSITIDAFESQVLSIIENKRLLDDSASSNKGEVSHDGKSRDKQKRTYCKKSTDQTKDIIRNIINMYSYLILKYEIKNKYQLKLLLYKIVSIKLKTINDFNIYLTPSIIKQTINTYLIYNDDKINGYMKKYNLKTSNNNDYAYCIYNAINKNKIIELV